MAWNNLINNYENLRKFNDVFPDNTEFIDRIKPFLFENNIVDDDLTKIFNKLDSMFHDNYFRFRTYGSIYSKTAEFTDKTLSLINLNNQFVLENDKFVKNENETLIYNTDNTRDSDTNKYLTKSTKTNNKNTKQAKVIAEEIIKMKTKINISFNDFRILFMNHLIGDEFQDIAGKTQ